MIIRYLLLGSSKKREITIDNFKFLRKLGDGAQGKVYLVEKLNGIDAEKVYALKVFEKGQICDNPVLLECLKSERSVSNIIYSSSYILKLIYFRYLRRSRD